MSRSLYLKISIIALVALLIIPMSSSFAQTTNSTKTVKRSLQNDTNTPDLTILPTHGPAGVEVNIYAHFPVKKGSTIGGTGKLYFDSKELQLVMFDYMGFSISHYFLVPSSAQPGPHTVTVTDNNASATAIYVVVGGTTPTLYLSPSSGPAGSYTTVTGYGFQSREDVTIKFYTLPESSTTVDSDGGFQVKIQVPPSSRPGTYPVIADDATSNKQLASSPFTVIGTSISPKTMTGKTGLAPNTPSSGSFINNGTKNEKSTLVLGSGTTPGANSQGSGSQNQSPNQSPNPLGNPITKRPTGKSQDSGTTFQVIKTVSGGTAKPSDFDFVVTLTGSAGSAKYNIDVDASGKGQFNLDLPQGNALDHGSYAITEADSLGYTVTYSKGCTGTYENDGYMYTCYITNAKKTTTNTVPAVTKTGPLPPQPAVPSSKTTLPTIPGKVTTPTIGKNPTPGTGKITLPPTSNKVTSCPAGTILVNGQCVAKGKVIGALQ